VATVIDTGSSPAEAAAACSRAGLVALVPAAGTSFTLSVDGESLGANDTTDVDVLALRWATLLAERS
jgi:hypothetical protein